MSGPTSLQRAPSCCQHRYRHHRHHYYHHHHHHRYHRNRDESDRCEQSRVSCGGAWSRVNNGGRGCLEERLTVDERLEQQLQQWNRHDVWDNNNEEREKDRVLVDYEEENEVDELDLFSTVGVSIEDECEEARLRAERLEADDDDREKSERLSRCSWQVDYRDLPRQQRCRRNGGRGFATNMFLLATASAFIALAVVLPPVSGTSSEKDEATRIRMGGKGTGTALAETPPNVDTKASSSFGGFLSSSVDILAALQLYNTTRIGVTQVPGLDRLRPAYYLQGEGRDLRFNGGSFEHVAAILRRVPEFTLAAALRQEEANSGTIVAFSHGNNRYLELQSSGRKDELRLHYVSRRDGAVHVEVFPFRLADGAWHRLALSISGSQVELLVDCHPLYRRLLRAGPPDTNFTLPQLQLWVGQRSAKHFLFKGALQDVKLIPGAHGYLSQCPQLDSSCPTCGQFSMLQNTVEQLMHNLNELTQRLAAAEGRISKVEECECQKSCRINGTVHEDGATWEKDCKQCSCVSGEIQCRPTQCEPVTCKNPVILENQCCPSCLKQCLMDGELYDHGVKISPKPCSRCKCLDGVFTCERLDKKTVCPPLPCPASEQISVAEECCKFCPGVDYCAKGHKCHATASCLNLQTTYACHCNIGFQGDGHKCHDVDECKHQGGSEGHHCNANTRCVNVVGSYICECLPGYHRTDKYNCAELDECATANHSCSVHATCINTVGSYYCVCKDGYTGDGYTCKPKCEQSCQNGGECVAPGRCSCRRGYIGNSCELDLDECASDLHRCHHSSTCFNMPGWYYCRCKPGYRSALHENNQDTQCLDIDECNDQTIERRHTCHPSARCVNTEGGYECSCLQEDGNQRSLRNSSTSAALSSSAASSLLDSDCRLSCWFEGRELANGENFAPADNACRHCTCKDGVITCREPICDCSAPESHRIKCCPQCDPAASCRHQELHHLVFRSGERWIYQCQTCECLYGEIDCWQMECPPVTCPNPVTEDGDCCHRCEDDPCGREFPGVAVANGSAAALLSPSDRPQPCSYAGLLHDSGSSWQDLHDKCTTCECKDGQLCCSYDYRCAGYLDGKRQSAISFDKLRPIFISRGTDSLRQNIDSPEATVSTALPESFELVSSSNSNLREVGVHLSTIRTTPNDLFVDVPVSSSSDTSVPILPLSTESDFVTFAQIPRAEQERAAISLPASAAASTPPPPKTAASIDRIPLIEGEKYFTALNNIETSKYLRSVTKNKKKSGASRTRRRKKGEPRLVNGNLGGNDAT